MGEDEAHGGGVKERKSERNTRKQKRVDARQRDKQNRRNRKNDLPEIDKPVLSRSKRLTSDNLSSPDLSKTVREPETKIIPPTKESLGTCFKELDCKIPFLYEVTKAKCKDAGGKSWKEKDCENL